MRCILLFIICFATMGVSFAQAAGAKFTACGQAMKFLEIEKEILLPGIKLAYSAKTVISTYSRKGFIITDVTD